MALLGVQMSSPTVSVLLPVYNRSSYVAEAIRSALDQTYADLEVVVVDDGSVDGSAAVVERFASSRVRLIRQAHRGPSAALNTAFRASRGRYIALLDSDDAWLPALLASEVPILEGEPDVGVVYARAEAMDIRGGRLARVTGAPPKYPDQMCASLLYGDHLSHITILVRRESVERVGLWDEDLSGAHDWDLCLRLSLMCRFRFVDDTHARFRIHPGRLTAPASDQLARVLAARIGVLDKFYARPDLPPEAIGMRALAYSNVHTDIGLRWLSARRWRRGLRELASAVRISPRPLSVPPRILWLLLYYRVLARWRWSVRLVDASVRWRRRHER